MGKRKREREGADLLFCLLVLSRCCLAYALPSGAVCWSVVCDRDISLSYSFLILSIGWRENS